MYKKSSLADNIRASRRTVSLNLYSWKDFPEQSSKEFDEKLPIWNNQIKSECGIQRRVEDPKQANDSNENVVDKARIETNVSWHKKNHRNVGCQRNNEDDQRQGGLRLWLFCVQLPEQSSGKSDDAGDCALPVANCRHARRSWNG